jgi:hypothetical protein
MKHIKLFENFIHSDSENLYIANYLAEKALIESNDSINAIVNEGLYKGEFEWEKNIVKDAVAFLESKGFTSPEDFIITESLDVKSKGLDGDKLVVSIGGHAYGYGQKEGDIEITDIARKFEKMLQFSAGRALVWLKKHATLLSGGKTLLDVDMKKLDEGKDLDNYMFFQNLKTIQESIAKILALDPMSVDSKLSDGHDWANDHIATSKDDIEEVCGFLCNNIKNDIFVGVEESVSPAIKAHEGKRIKLISMGVDPRSGKPDPNPIKPGSEGVVVKVDDRGNMHVKWDNGRSLSLIPETDKFTVLPDKK